MSVLLCDLGNLGNACLSAVLIRVSPGAVSYGVCVCICPPDRARVIFKERVNKVAFIKADSKVRE